MRLARLVAACTDDAAPREGAAELAVARRAQEHVESGVLDAAIFREPVRLRDVRIRDVGEGRERRPDKEGAVVLALEEPDGFADVERIGTRGAELVHELGVRRPHA